MANTTFTTTIATHCNHPMHNRTKTLLREHDNYHELCRLLGRLKTNYQLSELVAVDCYGEWIQLVSELTIESLKSWQWAGGSVYYLLGLWSRLVRSVGERRR